MRGYWESWLVSEFDHPLKRAIIQEIAEALERFRSQAEVHHRLMHCTKQLTHWLEHAPEVVAHVDARDWAHDLVESRGWVAAEPLVFLD